MKTRVFGSLLLMESVFMLMACGVSVFYRFTQGEDDLLALGIATLATLGVGGLCMLIGRNGAGASLTRRDSLLVVALVWIVFSILGMVPYLIYGTTDSVAIAFFETISGFTSTGATALTNIDLQPHGILFWRSMTQWMGGLGIVVFSFALIPIYELRNTHLFSAEVTGISVDKLQPRIGDTARRLLLIYSLITAACALAYWLGGMGVFDAVCHSMTTIATGGFSTHQESFAWFHSPLLEYISVVFMFLGSLNFSLYYHFSTGRHDIFRRNEEFHWFGAYIIFCVLFFYVLMCWLLRPTDMEQTLRTALFHVMSIASSTGYQGTNFDYVGWGEAFWTPTMILMFVGACAGSTGGGVKMIRVMVCLKHMVNEFRLQLHPRAVLSVCLSGRPIPEGKVTRALTFMFIYFVIFILGTILLTTIGIDSDTALGSTLSCLSNIGPAMGSTGPASTYAVMPPAALWLLSAIMLIGRLELYTMLFLLMPSFWKEVRG